MNRSIWSYHTRPRVRRTARAVAVTATVVVSVTACSSSSKTGSSKTTPAAAAGSSTTGVSTSASASAGKLKTIEFINPAPAQEAWQVTAKCFTDEAKVKGLTAKVVGTPGVNTNGSAELEFIQQATAANVGGIAATSYANGASLEPAFAAARAKGILIATMESGDATQARNFDVGLDIPKFGRDVADEIAARPGKHNVAILDPGLTGTPLIFNIAFKAEAAKKSNVTVTQIISDDGIVTKDAGLVGSLLTAHPDVTDIVAVNPGSTAGVVTAIREHGKIGKVFLTGNSKADPAKAALDSGAASAFYVQKQCDLGTLAVDNMVLASMGKTVARNIPVETSFATKANFASFDSKWD